MKRVRIKARPDHADHKKRFKQDVTIELGDDIENDYEVVEKDFPDDLPESWIDPDDNREMKIKWLSNFGLRRPDGKFEDKLPKGRKYKVELSGEFGTLVYFDGKEVRKLAGRRRGNKFRADLDLGDPPIGDGFH